MKVLFAINDENIVSEITSRYQQKYKEIITSKSVYYFNAILKELQNERDYDAIVIGEDLEPIADNNYDRIDRFILEKMDEVSDEASQQSGSDIPIILICSDRRTRNDPILAKLFSMSIYNAITGSDRTIEQVCELISKPRGKKEAKAYYNMNRTEEYDPITGEDVSESEIQSILNHYTKIAGNEQKCVESFNIIASQYNPKQLKIIVNFLPMSVKSILEKYSTRYQQLFLLNGKVNKDEKKANSELLTVDISNGQKLDQPVVIPATLSHPVTEFNNTGAYINNNGINGQVMNNPYMNYGQMNQMQRPMQGNPYMNQYNQGNPYNNVQNPYQTQRPMQQGFEQNNQMQRNPNMINNQQMHPNMQQQMQQNGRPNMQQPMQPNAHQMQQGMQQIMRPQMQPNMQQSGQSNMQQGIDPRPMQNQMGQIQHNNVQSQNLQFTNIPQNNQVNNIQNQYNQFANVQNKSNQMNQVQQNSQFANIQYSDKTQDVNEQHLGENIQEFNQQNSESQNINMDSEEQKKNLEINTEPKNEQNNLENNYQDIASVFDTPVIPDPEPIPTQEVPEFHLDETTLENPEIQEAKGNEGILDQNQQNSNPIESNQMDRVNDEIKVSDNWNNLQQSSDVLNGEEYKKKDVIEDNTGNIGDLEDQEDQENEEKVEQEVKRGRGRPRKTPIEEVEDKPKRGRGRPRKIKPEDELEQTQTMIEPMELTQTQEQLPSQVKTFEPLYKIEESKDPQSNLNLENQTQTIKIDNPDSSINTIQQYNPLKEIRQTPVVQTFEQPQPVQTPEQPKPMQIFEQPNQSRIVNSVEPIQVYNPIDIQQTWNNTNHEELNTMPSLGFEPTQENFNPLIHNTEPTQATYKSDVQNLEPVQDTYKPIVQNIEPKQEEYKPVVQSVEPKQEEYKPVVQNVEPQTITIPTINYDNNYGSENQNSMIEKTDDTYQLPSMFGEVADEPIKNPNYEEPKSVFDTSVFNDNQSETPTTQEQNIPNYDTSVDSIFGEEIAPISTNINQPLDNANSALETNTYNNEQNNNIKPEETYQIQNIKSPFENEVQQPTNINDILGNIQRPVENQNQMQSTEMEQQENDGGFSTYNIPSPFENDMNVNNDLGTYANLVNQQENYEDTYMPNNFQNPQLYNQEEYSQPEQQSILNMGNGKLCVFTGTSKNGVSFIVNNLAQMLIQSNVKVAILDETQNRNSFYIYTNNDEPLINKAVSSIKNLENGVAKGLDVSRYLTVYTNIPDGGLENKTEDVEAIVSTLTHNYDIILVDSDFETNEKFFAYASEIYVVQSMDALTIQPITKFLSELKDKGLLQEEKLRIIINKYMNMKRLPAEIVIEGLTRYNEPTMTLQKELFDSKRVPAILIPFDMQAYTRYMDVIATCQMTLNGYPTVFLNSLDKLASIIYGTAPELAKINSTSKNKSKKRGFFAGKLNGKKQKEEPAQTRKNVQPQYNEFNPNQYLMNNNLYSNEMNDTLNKMKKNY